MSTEAEKFIIRPLTKFAEFDDLVDMQQHFAGIESWEVYPKKLFKVATQYGGTALCLFDPENKPRGFAYHIPGRLNGELIGWSYLLIIDRDLDNGRWVKRLRQAQKERALSSGISKLYWTIDPLDARAAELNFSEFGTLGVRYLADFPDKSGPSFQGLPMADRLLLEWDLKCESPASAPASFSSTSGEDNLIIEVKRDNLPTTPDLTLVNSTLLLPVPHTMGSRIEKDSKDYTTWRQSTRAGFTHYLNLGYRAVSFLQDFDHKKRIGAYLLERVKR